MDPKKEKGIDWWEVGGNRVTIPCDIDLTLVCVCICARVGSCCTSRRVRYQPKIRVVSSVTTHKQIQMFLNISIAKEISF